MPFALSHKASKGKLRRAPPAPLDLSTEQHKPFPSPTGLPTPPQTADSTSFKMFGWKKKSSPPSPLPYFPPQPPRPILKTASSNSSGSSIRFAGSNSGHGSGSESGSTNSSMSGHSHSHGHGHGDYAAPPRVVITPITPEPQPTRLPSPNSVARRSSRPTSPSASSFGARIRTSQQSMSMSSSSNNSSNMNMGMNNNMTTAIPASHITTPPTAYVSTMQERAPPPPSPYRPTSERHRASNSFARPLPGLMSMGEEMAARPPRRSSLFATSESMTTISDQMVPMLNIIPATPQDSSEEFSSSYAAAPPSPQRKVVLEEAVKLDELEEVPLDEPRAKTPQQFQPPQPSSMTSIDVQLDFSPFQPLADLPSSTSFDFNFPPTESLPPSPPFESFPSLPSLASMPSSASDASMPTSSSSSSLGSIPDVEEALGSMLASLSDTDLPEIQQMKQAMSNNMDHSHHNNNNPGLGLGLDIDLVERSTISSSTAPLSPARRRAAPPPLDLSRVKYASKPENNTAPPCINHRVAFYRTAKAAPNSPSSGVFTVDLSHSSHGSFDLAWNGNEHHSHGVRDSMSMASESSDDDLHTASIISLTPVLGDRPRMVEVREEVMLPTVEVGLAI